MASNQESLAFTAVPIAAPFNSSPPRPPHPSYEVMIRHALNSMDSEKWASKKAISKVILDTYENLAHEHDVLLGHYLKLMKNNGTLSLVGRSYKLASGSSDSGNASHSWSHKDVGGHRKVVKGVAAAPVATVPTASVQPVVLAAPSRAVAPTIPAAYVRPRAATNLAANTRAASPRAAAMTASQAISIQLGLADEPTRGLSRLTKSSTLAKSSLTVVEKRRLRRPCTEGLISVECAQRGDLDAGNVSVGRTVASLTGLGLPHVPKGKRSRRRKEDTETSVRAGALIGDEVVVTSPKRQRSRVNLTFVAPEMRRDESSGVAKVSGKKIEKHMGRPKKQNKIKEIAARLRSYILKFEKALEELDDLAA